MPDKVNLESLITKEELDQLKNIRVGKLPEQIQKLDEGAFGEVFLFKFENGNFCVGKKPKLNLFKRSTAEENIIKKHLKYAIDEISILHQLRHERIIKFFGVYLDQDQVMIFMERMTGSVKDEINKKTCLSEKEAMHYFTQAAEGLVYLHSRRPNAIIHRDIKCENLLLTVEKNVKLADFGLAVDLTISSASVSVLSTAPTAFAGTYLFAAPEVIGKMEQPEKYGRKSDIWSLACTLVQMISGKPPYSDLTFYTFVKSSNDPQQSSNASRNPLTFIFDYFYRSLKVSSSTLKYSGDLVPTASNAIKQLLNSLFIVESKLRPSAEHVLALAYVAMYTITKDDDSSSSPKDNGHIQRLQSTIKKAIGQEDANAQFNLGTIRENGHGVSQSDVEACRWYRKAAEQEHANGQYRIGLMYQDGRGVPQSDEEAVKWYRKAAEQGHASGQYYLGVMYDMGQGVTQSDEEAFKWYRKAAEQGDTHAQFKLGFMYKNGRGVPQSNEEAVKRYRKAAEQGHASSQYYLGVMYDIGQGVTQSDEEAFKWCRKAAEQGDANGQCYLGVMYDIGQGVSQSNEEAFKWYRKAAEQGDPHAQFKLGLMNVSGRGVSQSDEEAAKWFRKAAEQGRADSQNWLGELYYYGRGVSQSDEEAVKWYRKAVEQAYACAQSNLGRLYMYGRGVPQSDEEAYKWYIKAVERGNVQAQNNLGFMYQYGRGVPQSDEEAVIWYIKAAEQGNGDGQINLGFMYQNGRGVPQSDEEALECYRNAQQFFVDGENNLGLIYRNGRDEYESDQSDEEALKWYRIAAEHRGVFGQYKLNSSKSSG